MSTLATPRATTGRYRVFETPAGRFALIGGEDLDLHATWLSGDDRPPRGARLDRTFLPGLSRTLERYFQGERVSFGDVPVPRGPQFFRRCWEACCAVPRGATVSYAELARRAGSPGAARSAGQAMRTNRLAVVIPCHRVIGAGGALHGYAGSVDGQSQPLRIKRYLLDLERAS